MSQYTLLICINGNLSLATSGNGKHVVATEDNAYLLNEMGDRLIESGVIEGYQLAKLMPPVIKEQD